MTHIPYVIAGILAGLFIGFCIWKVPLIVARKKVQK